MRLQREATRSAAAEALAAAGDTSQAEDVAALDQASSAAQMRLGVGRESLVQRLIYGPVPELEELCAGAEHMLDSQHDVSETILDASLAMLAAGHAFSADNKLSSELRQRVAQEGTYGFTVPSEFGGLGLDYSKLAAVEEEFAANGLGALAVEISGQLTIGASALLGYGSDEQRSTFLPLIADGTLIAFALTEVGTGVNAKRIQAWVERDDESGCWRLSAEGACNKLYITSAGHGGLAAVVARKGKESREIGLFIVSLPDEDVDDDYGFQCTPSNVNAFAQNLNSRLEFRNFPIPFENEIQGDGVEVLFYCLRMGRCMLAAMCAGYQRMMAADAFNYAMQREGVGGKVFKHELPRLKIASILGGALTSQALAHLSLAQDAAGVDLAGLRDLTKSASARLAMASLISCEHVIGGRSLDYDSRITAARPVIHAFGIVEGEDDLIRLGMVKDLTAAFTDEYLKDQLGILAALNSGKDGAIVPAADRIYRIGPSSLVRHPARTMKAVFQIILSSATWRIAFWALRNGLTDFLKMMSLVVPTKLLPRYRSFPHRLARHIRYAERGLRRCRWIYLLFNAVYQLDLTRAQIPLQLLGKRIELLVTMLATCTHASRLAEPEQRVADLQAELIRNEIGQSSWLRELRSIRRLRCAVESVASDLEVNDSSLLRNIDPEPFAHPWN